MATVDSARLSRALASQAEAVARIKADLAQPRTTPYPLIFLTYRVCPGDIAVFTALVRDLHRAHPGRFLTSAIVDEDEGGQNHYLVDENPLITSLDELPDDTPVLKMDYGLVNRCNQDGRHFIWGYIDDFNRKTGLNVALTDFKPDLYLSAQEQAETPFGLEKPYWLLVAGGKSGYATKLWNPVNFQILVNMLKDTVRFVQVGLADDIHIPLEGVVNLIGRTNLRQLMQLVYHAQGVVCPVTGTMHIAAGFQKPCVVVAYSGEAAWWEGYTAENLPKNVRTAPVPSTLPANAPNIALVASETPSAALEPHVGHRFIQGPYQCDRQEKPGWGCWRSKVTTGEFRERCAHLRNEHGYLTPECVASIEPEMVADAIVQELHKLQAPAVVHDAKPVMNVFANMVCLGGGERSTLTLMEQLRKHYHVRYWPLTPVNAEWRSWLYKATDSRMDIVTEPPAIPAGEHVFIYMNDYHAKKPWGFCVQADKWKAALSQCQSLQLVLNFTLGGVERQHWMADKLRAVYFLNSTTEATWKARVQGTDLFGAVTVMLPPPVKMDEFLSIVRTPTEPVKLVVGRVGGSAAKLPPGMAEVLDDCHALMPNVEFWFMPADEAMMLYAKSNRWVKCLPRDFISVKSFLEHSCVFWYPMTHDQGPRVVIEAMAAGLPVVAENREGPKDRIENGLTGFLTDTRVEMPEILKRLVDSPQIRYDMGQRAREVARRWTPEAWIGRIKQYAGEAIKADVEEVVPVLPPASPGPFIVYLRKGIGIGNILQAIPAMKALATMGPVYVENMAGAEELLAGQSYVKAQGKDIFQFGISSPLATAHLEMSHIQFGTSEVEANMALARQMGYRGVTPAMTLELPDTPKPDKPPYIVLSDGGHRGGWWDRKHWPWWQLLAVELKKLEWPLVFLGHGKESRQWMAEVGEDLCGKTTLLEAACVLKYARLFIGNDCGLGHMAAAVECPVLALFGPTNITKNKPFGKRVETLTSTWNCLDCQANKGHDACTDWKCMASLSVEAVLDKAMEVLA